MKLQKRQVLPVNQNLSSVYFSLCQVSACEMQPFSCHELTNGIYSQTAKTVFSHLKQKISVAYPLENLQWLSVTCFSTACTQQQTVESVDASMSF